MPIITVLKKNKKKMKEKGKITSDQDWCNQKQNLSLFHSKKVQVGNDHEKAQSEKDSHSKNRGGKKQTNNKVLIP